MRATRGRRGLACAALLVLAACGGGGATPPQAPAVATVTVSPGAPVLTVGLTQQLTAVVQDVNGSVLARAVTWSSNAPLVASVSATGLATALTVGSATISATASGVIGTAAVTSLVAPLITGVSPATLVPGAIATITGAGFDATIANDTVTVQGVLAPVVSATVTQVSFVVPCAMSGAVGVRVRTRVGPSALFATTLQGIARTIPVGQAWVSPDVTTAACTELAVSATPARYLVAVFSNATSANTLTDVDVGGNPTGLAPDPTPAQGLQQGTVPTDPRSAEQRRQDAAHYAFLERERQWFATARPRGITMNARVATGAGRAVALGDMRSTYFTFTVGCSDSSQVVRGKAIYVGTRSIIWEDSANTLQSASLPALATSYQRIGQQFDSEQYASDSATFGDPLRRDAQTDGDGKVHMVFTQRLNGSGAAAYVTACDQFTRGPGLYGSNLGEYFYGNVPTTATPNVNSTASPDGWFAFMGRTVAHEVKHIISMASRVANGAPSFEASWLEEGTARHAEEGWVRSRMHNTPWKANRGFGTAAANGLFCDFALGDATCLAGDATHRPSWGMRRHFDEILPKLTQPWNWSPYGDGSGQSGSVFYQTTWSLVRYAMDRYAVSENAFLTGLVNATSVGVTNLSAQAGVPIDQLIGGWGLALYADDYPGLAGASADIGFATWNLRDIYAGLHAQPAWSGRYPTTFPIAPTVLGWGAFAQRVTALRGGAHMYFELQGTPAQNQLISLRSIAGDGTTPGTIRIAITRLQ